ncbi:hypothetical protein ACHAW6_005275 [Cyclotella cf. meneghiniana]
MANPHSPRVLMSTICMIILSTVTSFVMPTSPSPHKPFAKLRTPFISSKSINASHGTTHLSSSNAAADSSPHQTKTANFKYEGYDKPIVLIGASSSPEANELQRLALSLSGALAGNQSKKLQSTVEKLERSQGAGLLSEQEEDASNVSSMQNLAGISLSALGLDDDGPFVLDSSLIGDLVRERTLTLTSGVIVLDFNHPAFHSYDGYNAKEYEIDLVRALSSLAKQLYEDEGLLVVYVNVQPDDGGSMNQEAKDRKKLVEKEVLIPFSDYELCIKNEGQSTDSSAAASWSDMEWELQRIVARALLPPPVVGGTGPHSADLTMGLNTFFLSLSFPKVEDASPYVEEMCKDVDSMEYRVDLLSCSKDYLAQSTDNDDIASDARFEILHQQQRLRSLCRPYAKRAPALPFGGASIIDDALPIVYTVRTAHQAGTWPDDKEGVQKMFELLELGLRSGVEVLDVESAWDASLTDKLLAKAQKRYTSLILGSHHVVGSEVTPEEAVKLFRQCRMNNRAHGGKVVLSINDDKNNKDQMAYEASLAAAKLDTPVIPNIGLVLGEHGSYSRIINPRFTPVTHESLPVKAAPGQLTAAEIMAARLLTGQIPSERYAILGHNIAYSVSPQMQGGAFAAVKLPHTYTRADVEKVEEFVEGPIWNDDNFGGCSVTIPHKQNIIPHVDILTDSAKEIGSVNTVIVKKDKFGTRVLIGDNTDWKGIYNPLKRRLGDILNGKAKIQNTALILGGGGTARAAAYAATKLGLEKIYFNRTPEKAEELAREFGGIVAKNLDEDSNSEGALGATLKQSGSRISVVISTLPAAAEFQLPDWLLANDPLPVVFDVNYKPYSTSLLLQATEKGCDVVRGSEMLWEQGVGQFELWTGRTAPYGVMKKVVLENCLPPSS